ncbi:MAG: universal stress protein [Deltaproteobacteria bacterium]|jgi:universal stress protein A
MIWKTILVPHDFSSSANHACAVARDEAKTHGARVILVHVIDLPYQMAPESSMIATATEEPVSMKEYASRGAEKHLDDIAARLAKDGIQPTKFIRFGRPHDEITKLADEAKCDLIIMGTHGRTGLAHLLVGSVAERVVRTSKVPVLTVPMPDHS